MVDSFRKGLCDRDRGNGRGHDRGRGGGRGRGHVSWPSWFKALSRFRSFRFECIGALACGSRRHARARLVNTRAQSKQDANRRWWQWGQRPQGESSCGMRPESKRAFQDRAWAKLRAKS